MRNLAVATTLLFVFAMTATLLAFQARSERAVRDGILTQARAHAQQFNAVRTYVQGFTGIYVPAAAGVAPNPYLNGIEGVVPTLSLPDGREYVLQNSPIVAREVSRILREDTATEPVRLSLHGMAPLNPDNEPDAFALLAMDHLANGDEEIYRLDRDTGGGEFRYALAVPCTEKCGRCHSHLVGQEGKLAGVSVVRMDVSRPMAYISTSREWMSATVVFIIIVSALMLYVFISRFLADMHRAQSQVYDLARKDSLTGLATRRVGVESLNAEVGRSLREKQCVACCLVDLDDFKAVNDTFGHAVGDLVLASVGEMISTSIRPYDTAARVGGEEFLLVLPGACEREAEEIMTRAREAVRFASTIIEQLDKPVTCSVGIAIMYPSTPETPRELYVRADAALLTAKHGGKDCSVVAGPATGTDSAPDAYPISAW